MRFYDGVFFTNQSSGRNNRQTDKKSAVNEMNAVPELQVQVRDRKKEQGLAFWYSGCMPHWQDDFRVVSNP